uniref:Uncharacterized protein n=1 Tax=Aegilops tauschii subsp. strangulata TaxID=200361 RepID=A0A453R6X4_AEGTS
ARLLLHDPLRVRGPGRRPAGLPPPRQHRVPGRRRRRGRASPPGRIRQPQGLREAPQLLPRPRTRDPIRILWLLRIQEIGLEISVLMSVKIVCALALTFVMGQRYLETSKIMPAGVVAGLSALMSAFYLFKIATGGNHFSPKKE